MVPGLYEESEKDGIVGNIRDEAVKRGTTDSKDSLWNYFVGKCRDNLHVVLAMSPVGETLRVRCRSFPGMVNNSVIDWFVPWPEQALLSVAGVFLAEEDLPDTMRQPIVNHMVMVHTDSMARSEAFEQQLKRYNYVTPKNYLDLISTYRSVLKEERRKIDSLIGRLDGGLSKVRDRPCTTLAGTQRHLRPPLRGGGPSSLPPTCYLYLPLWVSHCDCFPNPCPGGCL